MINYSCISSFLIIIILINYVEARLPLPISSHIDSHRNEYLKAEKKLWHYIDNCHSDSDTNYVLEQIHGRHQVFLQMNFAAKNVPLSYLDTRHTSLLDATQTVNIAVDVLLKNYLHVDSNDFKQEESLLVARQHIHLIKEIDCFYNATSSDFFEEIQNVSELK